MVRLRRFLHEQFGKALLARRVAGEQDRPLQRPPGALKLGRLLVVDLDVERRADLPHPFRGRLLARHDGIDLTNAGNS